MQIYPEDTAEAIRIRAMQAFLVVQRERQRMGVGVSKLICLKVGTQASF